MNTGIKMMSAMNLFMPFRTGVYPQPTDASWMAAGALLFAQLANAPLINLFKLNPPAKVWIGLRIGI